MRLSSPQRTREVAKKPVKTPVSTIPKGKRKGKYAPATRKGVGTTPPPNPLDRYKPKK